MGQIVLLTGEPQVGKTTIIQQIIERLDCEISGFYTQEIREGKERKGFRIVTLDGVERLLAHVDIESSSRVGKYGLDLSALDFIVSGSLEKSIHQNTSVFVIDEIGPMEISSKRFCLAVTELFKKDVVVIGTIVKRSFPFTDEIKSQPNITVMEVSRDNQEKILQEVLGVLKKTRRCKVKAG